MADFDITKHILVPKHELLSEKQKEALLKKYDVTLGKLPKIFINDPAIQHLSPKTGDIIKIVRKSPTAGESVFYRVVVK